MIYYLEILRPLKGISKTVLPVYPANKTKEVGLHSISRIVLNLLINSWLEIILWKRKHIIQNINLTDNTLRHCWWMVNIDCWSTDLLYSQSYIPPCSLLDNWVFKTSKLIIFSVNKMIRSGKKTIKELNSQEKEDVTHFWKPFNIKMATVITNLVIAMSCL